MIESKSKPFTKISRNNGSPVANSLINQLQQNTSQISQSLSSMVQFSFLKLARTQQESSVEERESLLCTQLSEEVPKSNTIIKKPLNSSNVSKGIVSAVPASIQKRTIQQAKVATLRKQMSTGNYFALTRKASNQCDNSISIISVDQVHPKTTINTPPELDQFIKKQTSMDLRLDKSCSNSSSNTFDQFSKEIYEGMKSELFDQLKLRQRHSQTQSPQLSNQSPNLSDRQVLTQQTQNGQSSTILKVTLNKEDQNQEIAENADLLYNNLSGLQSIDNSHKKFIILTFSSCDQAFEAQKVLHDKHVKAQIIQDADCKSNNFYYRYDSDPEDNQSATMTFNLFKLRKIDDEKDATGGRLDTHGSQRILTTAESYNQQQILTTNESVSPFGSFIDSNQQASSFVNTLSQPQVIQNRQSKPNQQSKGGFSDLFKNNLTNSERQNHGKNHDDRDEIYDCAAESGIWTHRNINTQANIRNNEEKYNEYSPQSNYEVNNSQSPFGYAPQTEDDWQIPMANMQLDQNFMIQQQAQMSFVRGSNENNFQQMQLPARNSAPNNQEFKLNLNKILNMQDIRTTIMIKNIPNKYTQRMLLQKIDENHALRYDFFYLPIDFKNKCNMGYAFINFVDPIYILKFYDEMNGKSWDRFKSEKICELTYGRIQGQLNLIDNFSQSSLTHSSDRKVKPLILNAPLPSEQYLKEYRQKLMTELYHPAVSKPIGAHSPNSGSSVIGSNNERCNNNKQPRFQKKATYQYKGKPKFDIYLD